MEAPEVPSGTSEPFSDPRRRSPRVARRVTLVVTCGKASAKAASVMVNEHGALLESPRSFPAGAALTLVNEATGKQADAWVIWTDRAQKPDTFDLGIELAKADISFWG